MKGLKYSDILRINKELTAKICGSHYRVALLSNIVVSPLKEILEYTLRTQGINAYATLGDYDNIIQDSVKYKDFNLVIVVWELSNIIEGFHYKACLLEEGERQAIISKVKSEIDFVFSTLKETSLVLMSKFSTLAFNGMNLKTNLLDDVALELNRYLETKERSNFILVDFNKIFALTSIGASVDFRYYYSSKALYTVDFYKNYCSYIKSYILSANGKIKKVLIFDCDNTLWGGILGEDGFDGLKMSTNTPQGAIFEEVQNIALEVNSKGIILGLCSKNNPEDVDEVLRKHPDMKIKDDKLTVKKVNWNEKVDNLKAIARELNLGLDSMVFIDDSDFEVNYVRNVLPQITVLQVPAKLYEYPQLLRENIGLFFALSESKEDMEKVQMYKEQAQRAVLQDQFSDTVDYLKSLNLELHIFVDNDQIIPRMAQMTQKTNQFNLTTKRYTESNIRTFVEHDKCRVFAFEVQDRFGSYGTAGLAIVLVDYDKNIAEIDTLLMSCRVIGRNIEFSFMDFIIASLKKAGVQTVCAKYLKTLKNEQVKFLYDEFGFVMESNNGSEKNYRLDIKNYQPRKINYIGVSHE